MSGPWLHVHTCTIEIRWGDMDAMGHVNNTVYFRYMEHARVEWLQQIEAAPNPEGEGPVIINAQCNFLRQLTYPGKIEVRTLVGPPGSSSFEARYEIRLLDAQGMPGMLHAEGSSKIVWVNFTKGKSCPLPERIRALLPAAGHATVT
ncbi:thioesterase family protein [Massilia sp. W12]|uniref:acyl-CoA thioesterase n=1 Tax=Massilia sp. W12 TaxID=3126507 RepID=UPI0030D476E3